MAKIKYIETAAALSPDRKYRYMLTREWRGTHDHKNWLWLGVKDSAGQEVGEPKPCVFIMLNPSTADAEVDDPTIRRCVGFARTWKYERLVVINLFAYRTSSPAELLALHHAADPVGWENEEWVEKAVEHAGIIICAWGAHGGHLGQDETMLGWLTKLGVGNKLHMLGITKQGYPSHPLYLKRSAAPEPFIFL